MGVGGNDFFNFLLTGRSFGVVDRVIPSVPTTTSLFFITTTLASLARIKWDGKLINGRVSRQI